VLAGEEVGYDVRKDCETRPRMVAIFHRLSRDSRILGRGSDVESAAGEKVVSSMPRRIVMRRSSTSLMPSSLTARPAIMSPSVSGPSSGLTPTSHGFRRVHCSVTRCLALRSWSAMVLASG
jgi:hypothetical protein